MGRKKIVENLKKVTFFQKKIMRCVILEADLKKIFTKL